MKRFYGADLMLIPTSFFFGTHAAAHSAASADTAFVKKQLLEATDALRKEDRVRIKKALKGDKSLYKREVEFNEAAINILALRQFAQ